ncbi:hypothetical protein GGX14DRAFT_397167 [Mycena pura]|uniref:Uncharacterized protein n=1 Tax=Mycena pura TaxID=153505 RepID=A0AAD6V8W5_9AGAR|nr:hypothetical protein GGX14DRAFT_397167 [Mycena pura]
MLGVGEGMLLRIVWLWRTNAGGLTGLGGNELWGGTWREETPAQAREARKECARTIATDHQMMGPHHTRLKQGGYPLVTSWHVQLNGPAGVQVRHSPTPGGAFGGYRQATRSGIHSQARWRCTPPDFWTRLALPETPLITSNKREMFNLICGDSHNVKDAVTHVVRPI